MLRSGTIPLQISTTALLLQFLLPVAAVATTPSGDVSPIARPNIVMIMVDELGYYEPGFNGGRNIRTPHLDRMAAEGMIFRNMLAGSSVCAPTRCCFLTGKHSGHTSVRVNGGGTPLRADEVTVASMLKPLGYATGGFGKWGNGGRDSSGVPEKHGFDVFFGYYDQVHAHSYYPPYLIRNSEEVPLEGNNGGSAGKTYSHYLIHEAAMDFIRQHHDQPFFAYLPYTPPHGIFSIPDEDPAWPLYKDEPWPEDARRYAAMVSMVDRQVGEVLGLLRELGLEENTLVIFSGDNGGADYFSSKEYPRGVHSANKNPETGVEYRGKKGTLYEGGLRIPFIARWPGRIKAGTVSDFLGYFPDLMPTFADLARTSPPADTDGVSIVPTLFGEQSDKAQKQHEYLYWEMGNAAAIRQGDWRAVRSGKQWELFDLSSDPSESINQAESNPKVLEKLKQLAAAAHEDAVEGTFERTDRHQRDRRAKVGTHDDPSAPDPLAPARRRAKRAAWAPSDGMIPNRNFSIVRVSSENAGNGKFATNIIDGDANSHWHSRFAPQKDEFPHEIIVDLGAEHSVRGFVCLSRQDGSWNGAIRDIEISVSQLPDKFDLISAGTTLEKSRELQTIPCRGTKGRYIRIKVLSGYSESGLASLAEFGVIGE
ncbi:MAG: sulfatase-like hydrolase/transferase [Planctomycetaceae bacterium]|nr:sulfatase-like hydrolase/transferase [Planctomycetaceae bacterium]